MKIDRTKNATRNMVFGTFLKLYQILLPFFMRSVIVYCLGVDYLGLNSLFTSILQVLNLAELGVGSAMVFSMYKPIAEDDDVTICALMKLYLWYYRIIGLIVLVGGLVITPFIPHLIKGEVPIGINIYVLYLLNLLATVLTYWLFAYRNSIFQAYQRTDVISKITIFTDSLKYGLQIISLFIFHNYYYYVISILVMQIFTNILTAIKSKKMYPQYNPIGKLPKETIKTINQKIKDLFTAKLGTTIVNSADTIVISAYLGLKSLAIYQNYYFIMTSVIGIIIVLLSSCTAGIGNSLITETIDKNYKDFKVFMLMEIWVSAICVCCFLNIYQPFMKLWMGKNNLLSFSCVILFCIYFYLYVVNHYFCVYKDAAGIWHEDRFRPLTGALVNLILNLILVKYIGIFAILLSTILSYIFIATPWLIYNLFSILFKRSFKEIVFQLFELTCYVFIVASISFFVCNLFNYNGIIEIIFKLIVSIFIPNLFFIFVLRKKDEFKGMLEIIDRITKRKFVKYTNYLRRKK